jgi:hypothetical protein
MKEKHKVIFAGNTILGGVFDRKSASVFSAIKAGILA